MELEFEQKAESSAGDGHADRCASGLHPPYCTSMPLTAFVSHDAVSHDAATSPIAGRYGVQGFPMLMVIGREGGDLSRRMGETKYDEGGDNFRPRRKITHD